MPSFFIYAPCAIGYLSEEDRPLEREPDDLPRPLPLEPFELELREFFLAIV